MEEITVSEVKNRLERDIKKNETASKILDFFIEADMTISEAISTLKDVEQVITQARLSRLRSPESQPQTVFSVCK